MNIKELHITAKKEMLGILFDNRKDIYSTFEFDYLHKMTNYETERQYQAVYQFIDKETKKVYSIEFFTAKSDNQQYIKEIRLNIE